MNDHNVTLHEDADLDALRAVIRANHLPNESTTLRQLVEQADLDEPTRLRIGAAAAELVRKVRADDNPGLMETFLAEYGLSTDEGIALMCLAEALLRVPDAETIDALIEDKIAPSNWGSHLGQSSSTLVNASTWALMLTGKVLDDDDTGPLGALRGAVRRLGEPVIRTAVSRAIMEMGKQFVLGRNIDEAMERASHMEAKGFTYSYDMLGEAACTEADAQRYHLSYSRAIGALAVKCTDQDIRNNPGISVKLSALHPRYETTQKERVLDELVPRTRSLALLAKSAGMGFNIDAEEADRLDLSLNVIERVISDPSLKGWDGFGVVVQAYGFRAGPVIDWLYALAKKLDRKIMVRLVKGAYWDSEIKHSQELGTDGFPVFTRKSHTDVSYLSNARKLLGMTDRIYPQFATHNAHTIAAVLEMAGDRDDFEFQRLHGMGENLHTSVLQENQSRCRIYAPVGAHRDLLAYLVRRLLENGANSSFVNQIIDESVTPEEVVSDPYQSLNLNEEKAGNASIASPADIYQPLRKNSKGWDVLDPEDLAAILNGRKAYEEKTWRSGPLLAGEPNAGGASVEIVNPANHNDTVGVVTEASASDVETALTHGLIWNAIASERASVLRNASDLYEDHAHEFFALAAREAGKTIADSIAELREAVDFLRYYADEAERQNERSARGLFACISPWNFPLAIFTGQISGALAAGNGVIAKPAEATPLIADKAISLLHKAGVPRTALQLLPGQGAVVGAALSSDPRIDGLCFTGSTATAKHIDNAMAKHGSAAAPLIAETGGLNAMIVDSTALPEQAVRDVVTSAFQSAGQRCSALRILYLQEEMAGDFLTMLYGAMDTLVMGDPLAMQVDIGPVIDLAAQEKINRHILTAKNEGRLLHSANVTLYSPLTKGTFVTPTVLKVSSIAGLEEEIFGPVLHVVLFDSEDLDQVLDDINASGYGLTFGMHTRIDDRVQHVVDRLNVGNIYINRNQIGAVVGSQPFGGEGMSGTGPKAGGPNYVARLFAPQETIFIPSDAASESSEISLTLAQNAIDETRKNTQPSVTLASHDLPGPTGESNRLSDHPRGIVLCLGPGKETSRVQASEAMENGCIPLLFGADIAAALTNLSGFDAVSYWRDDETLCEIRRALASRKGPILPLICAPGDPARYRIERHICIDTTASGGNAALLAAQEG